MSAPRKPRAARRSRAPRVTGTYAGTTASVGGGELVQAAQEIASGARDNAASWAKTGATVASIRVEQVDDNTVNIVADSGAAYPNEVQGVRHPTFGHDPWRTNQYRPFLAPAAADRADEAAQKWAERATTLARQAGFS